MGNVLSKWDGSVCDVWVSEEIEKREEMCTLTKTVDKEIERERDEQQD